MDDIAVRLEKVSKKYILHHEKPTLAESIFSKGKNEEFWALRDINLEIKRGEKVGIVGPNGAGKTTLLKIISGITTPTIGKVLTYGKMVSLMELEAGFHPELTGEENIFLNGLLIGMTKAEVGSKYKDIIKFADIGQFIDSPFYTYSGGMKFRLGFALAMASQCDILVIDEIFVSGDTDFQKKSFIAIKELQERRDITTIVCSHITDLVRSFSGAFYKLKYGKIKRMSTEEMSKVVNKQNKQWSENLRIS